MIDLTGTLWRQGDRINRITDMLHSSHMIMLSGRGFTASAVDRSCHSCGQENAEFVQYTYDPSGNRVDGRCVRCEAGDRGVYA